jgi:UDP:flavonoid glycosyltransferase YjiC (YdhE family)
VQQLKIGTGQRFSDANQQSLTAGLRWIITPEYLARAGKIAAEMISPHESASSAADLVESAAQAD